MTEPSATTRERLLDATWRVLRENGLRGATSRAIAAAAGANLGAITYHFGSKQSLIAAAAAARMASWTVPLAEALVTDEEDGGDRTLLLIPLLIERLGEATDDVRALLELVVSPDVEPSVVAAVRSHLATFQETIGDVMARRVDRGGLPDETDPTALAGLFTAIALGLMTQNVIGAHPAPLPAIVEEVLRLLKPTTVRTP